MTPLLIVVGSALFVLAIWWFAGRDLRRAIYRADSGEICHTCLHELTYGELWETHHHMENLPEMGSVGGTYMVGYWCRAHAPDGAVRWSP